MGTFHPMCWQGEAHTHKRRAVVAADLGLWSSTRIRRRGWGPAYPLPHFPASLLVPLGGGRTFSITPPSPSPHPIFNSLRISGGKLPAGPPLCQARMRQERETEESERERERGEQRCHISHLHINVMFCTLFHTCLANRHPKLLTRKASRFREVEIQILCPLPHSSQRVSNSSTRE